MLNTEAFNSCNTEESGIPHIRIQAELRYGNAIAREYLLKYDSSERQTIIEPGYFW